MKIFTAVYDWTLKWAEHKFAPRMLALLTFAESVFFPIPPDVLLAPMVLAKPEKAWRLASLTTISSILGGAVGYLLGYMMFEPWIQPLITEFGYQARFDTAITWFNEWGVWVVFIAGFSPIPASAIGRGMRFFLVAGLIQWGGEAITHKLRKWIDMIGWTVVALIIIAYLVLK